MYGACSHLLGVLEKSLPQQALNKYFNVDTALKSIIQLSLSHPLALPRPTVLFQGCTGVCQRIRVPGV